MRKVKIQQPSADATDMFSQILDPTKCDPDIIFPKYQSMMTKIKQVSRFLSAFGNGFLVEQFPEYDFSDIGDRSQLMEADLEQHIYTKDTIQANWPEFKDSESLKSCINIYSLLLPYAHYIKDPDNLSGKWISNAGLGFMVFDFSKLDLFIIWVDERCDDNVGCPVEMDYEK